MRINWTPSGKALVIPTIWKICGIPDDDLLLKLRNISKSSVKIKNCMLKTNLEKSKQMKFGKICVKIL